MIQFYSFLLLLLLASAHAIPEYSETLLVQPLAPASVLASFNFRGNATQSAYEQQHFQFFPRSLAQILQHANAKELHLRFSTGRWDAESWGSRPWDGVKEGGTGVEIWAWLEADTEEDAFQHWITLNNALAGLFCASMNFIDSTRTTRPVMTFEPQGDHTSFTLERLYLLHGTLPREVVCTENLTPFLKLLPCKGKAGIASLLDGHKLFDATWQTMSIDVRPRCPTGREECIVEIDQTVDMILDIERSKRPRDSPIPRPLPVEDLVCDTSKQYPGEDYCYPLDLSQTQEWSLLGIFGRSLKGTCLSTQNGEPVPPSVCIKGQDSLDAFSTGALQEHRRPSELLRCLTIPEQDFDLIVPKQDAARFAPGETPALFAERSITGHGQERGGVQALLTNPSRDRAVEFVYFESLPWFMKPYLHTLRSRVISNNAGYISSALPSAGDVIQDMYYRPGLDRTRGSQLEMRVRIPPSSTVVLSYDFEKAILRYTEYPPDANRGRDVAPAVIRILGDPSGKPMSGDGNAYLRTTPLMLPLPTPDFSMPYNVIILTSTVIALAFGNIFNVLVRRFVAADEAEGPDLKTRVMTLVGVGAQWVKARIAKGASTDEQKKTQ